MPCFTERRITLDLEVADQGVLTRALEALGYEVSTTRTGAITAYRVRNYRSETVQIDAGRATVTQGQEELVGEIKRGYAAEAIKTAGRKYGWNFAQDKQDQFHFTVQRRF